MKRLIAVSVTSALIFITLLVLKFSRFTENMLILSLIGAGMFLVGALVLKFLSPKIRFNRFFSMKQMSFLEWQITLCFAVLLICGSFLMNYLMGLLYDLLPVSVPPAFSGNGYSSMGVALLCIAVLPAVFEEVFFRGAVLTMLRTAKMKTMVAIGLSAVLFALLHGPSWYFLTDVYAGVLLALLIYFNGSIYAAIIAHFISNLVSYFLASYGERLTDAGIGDLTVHILVVCLIGAVCHLLHLLKKLVLRNEKEDRSRINENSRRWEEKVAKGEKE
ncbi:MAG: CPBP family intramembrane metalloprotease [Clostridia bacterium]|nr:CPBP family intramembrane metalloprotease [Clostridia bacterium]